ncbi:hypothetical protein BKA64DRAFT_441658 [Cadophora sp. MPI-SDFR-AT-0126]|nr:hypothetical protein BKA64DRAFT_441658 [Leotiomycetes sp. MPI-SDFR-AT-0126]
MHDLVQYIYRLLPLSHIPHSFPRESPSKPRHPAPKSLVTHFESHPHPHPQTITSAPTMSSKLLSFITLLLTIPFFLSLPQTSALAFPTRDLTNNNNNNDASLSPPPPSVSETGSYVCQEGCRRPCFDYGYCSSCDRLTGYEQLKCDTNWCCECLC